jgi:hypothetical protein
MTVFPACQRHHEVEHTLGGGCGPDLVGGDQELFPENGAFALAVANISAANRSQRSGRRAEAGGKKEGRPKPSLSKNSFRPDCLSAYSAFFLPPFFIFSFIS